MNEKKWGKLSSLGEILSSIAVIITLVYLAVEINQNTEALYAQSRQTVLSSAQQELLYLSDHPAISQNITKQEPLTAEESIQLDNFLTMSLRGREFVWLQYQNGVIDEAQWETELVVLQVILSTSRTRLWWNVLGRRVVGTEFAAFIDDELKDKPVSDEVWRLSATWSQELKESDP